MKCPTCGAWTQVLETRKRGVNVTRRRYECANLHRFTTLESVIDPTGPSSTPGQTEPSTSTKHRSQTHPHPAEGTIVLPRENLVTLVQEGLPALVALKVEGEA